MAAYYNEIDPFAVAWLRELIKKGLIADGEVDERSIVDVVPSELRTFTQCHFFAGIGVWSYALRQAGWPDDRPVWTGSCPCQPFSAAGKGAGFDDERHLWPHFHWLIEKCRPPVVIGEQVASKDGLGWIDLVQADLERSGYASGAVDTCAAGFGAPHIRQRLYWMAYSNECGQSGSRFMGRPGDPAAQENREVNRTVDVGGCVRVAYSDDPRLSEQFGKPRILSETASPPAREGAERNNYASDRLAHDDNGCFTSPVAEVHNSTHHAEPRGLAVGRPSPTNGYWRDADWLFCRDGKWRPVEPGTFPLAHGSAARVGRLRGYGNAIVAPQAQAFIEAVMEIVS